MIRLRSGCNFNRQYLDLAMFRLRLKSVSEAFETEVTV